MIDHSHQLNLGNLSLKKLQSFLAVAKSKSFRGAAEILNRSQPAVSMQVNSLEQDLGVRLFHRTTRSVTLTREGSLFFEHIEPAVTEIAKALSIFTMQTKRNANKIRISCAPTISSHLLVDVLGEFRNMHPNVEIEMREAVLDSMYNDLLIGTVDFGIGPEFLVGPRFDQQHIFADDIVAVTARGRGFHTTKPVPLSQFAEFPLLVSGPAKALWETIRDAFKSVNVSPNVQHEVVHTASLIGMVRADLGITFLPRYVAEISCDEDFSIHSICRPEISRNICFISLTGNQLSDQMQDFRDLVIGKMPKTLDEIFARDRKPNKSGGNSEIAATATLSKEMSE